MAYNYFPATYQPLYYPQQNVQPYQQNTQPSSLIWVGSFNEAQTYPVAPNNAVALWDSSSPAIYLKQADASGKPTIKVFDIVERTVESSKDNIEYATKNDLAAFGALLEGFKGEIEAMKGDMYGLAGKKRVKKEVEDE